MGFVSPLVIRAERSLRMSRSECGRAVAVAVERWSWGVTVTWAPPRGGLAWPSNAEGAGTRLPFREGLVTGTRLNVRWLDAVGYPA